MAAALPFAGRCFRRDLRNTFKVCFPYYGAFVMERLHCSVSCLNGSLFTQAAIIQISLRRLKCPVTHRSSAVECFRLFSMQRRRRS